MRKFLTILMLVFPCSLLFGNDDFKITWLISDSPPFNISSPGPLYNKGICDGVVNEVIAAMPDVEFELLSLPQPRVSKVMDEGEKVFFPCMIHRSQNNARASYSTPMMLYPPFVIITLANTAKHIIDKYSDSVDLTQLMNDESFQFGYGSGRRFDDNIQSIVEQSLAYKKAAISYNSEGAMSSLVQMMSKDRVDYIIDYPSNIQYFNTIYDSSLVAISIKQTQGKVIKGAIGCASQAVDNFAGKAIALINKALYDKVLTNPSYVEHLLFWMASTVPNYQALYQTLIVQESNDQVQLALKK
ncbi:hypothetical protein [Colwellia sp. MEBiC06753]